MFTGSTKSPPPKTPQPERLDEVYAALRRGLQSYLQVHQLELDSLGQQIRENKRNGRLGFLYEQDKQVKAIERFMRRLEFHLSKVEELYDAYCIQRRLRDGASKMVAAFNSATGSKEARESLSEANKGYRECTEHMCSLESELESHMGEFHIKMKGLAGFARLCAGDQYEVLMRYGRQRWRLRGRVEVSSKQVWDSEDYIFLPLITELLSIKVTELKSLANHVVVGSVSCETLDLFSPLPQTVAVDINDLGTVKLNLEVTWSPFDKDDQTSSSSTVSKRLLSNQSPPDTPSMREQVLYSLLKRQGELDNGTVWSNSSESSDDSSSPAMAHHAHRLTASHTLQTTPATQNLFTPHQSSTSTPSLSSNQEGDEPDTGEVFCELDSRKCATPNGHLQSCASDGHVGEINPDCATTDGASVQSVELSETSEDLSYSLPDVSSHCPVSVVEGPEALDLPEYGVPETCPSAQEGSDGMPEASASQADNARTEAGASELGPAEQTSSEEHNQRHQCAQEIHQLEDPLTGHLHSSSRFSQDVETALESFDFLNCSDLDEEEEEGGQREDKVEGEGEEGSEPGKEKHGIEEEKFEEQEKQQNKEEQQNEEEPGKDEEQQNKEEPGKEEEQQNEEEPGKEEVQQNEEGLGKEDEQQKEEEQEDEEGQENHEAEIYTDGSDEEGEGLEIFIEAPEGFRNSDEDYHSQSEVASMEDLQELDEMTIPDVKEEDTEEKEEDGEETSLDVHSEEKETSNDKDSCPSTPKNMATTVL